MFYNYHGKNTQEFSLLALGVRQVTFLKFNVYLVGLYADAAGYAAMKKLKSVSSESAAEILCDPKNQFAICIQPTRATNGVHLRQGLNRMLNSFLTESTLLGNEFEEARDSLVSFEREFPVSGNVKVGDQIWVTKSGDSLRINAQGKQEVVVRGKWLAQWFVQGYLTREISPQLKSNLQTFWQ